MALVLRDEGIPDQSGVAIEYKIPQTNKRVDFQAEQPGSSGTSAMNPLSFSLQKVCNA